MILTDNQLGLLYQIADVHLDWFILYSDTPPKYEDILKLNHQKMMDISSACEDCTEEMIDDIFRTILEDYKQMLKDIKG